MMEVFVFGMDRMGYVSREAWVDFVWGKERVSERYRLGLGRGLY